MTRWVLKLMGAGCISTKEGHQSDVPWNDYRGLLIDPTGLRDVMSGVRAASEIAKLAIVPGGTAAFLYIELARALGLEQHIQKQLGVEIINILGQLLLEYLMKQDIDVMPVTVSSTELSHDIPQGHQVAVIRADSRFQSSDDLATEVARKIDADGIIFFKQGVPSYYFGFEQPTLLNSISIEKLHSLAERHEALAGRHYLLDKQAIDNLRMQRRQALLVNPHDAMYLRDILEGKRRDNYTTIKYEG